MKKTLFMVFFTLWAMAVFSQPRPFEIDQSFIPTLEFMQKSWTGEYDGLEPNSRMIMSVKRVLVLNADLTYSNEVRGQIKNESEEVLLKSESGIYQYDLETQLITYSIEIDSTLDINDYLQVKEVHYVVNHYKQEGEEKANTEKAQFTRAANDINRQWVLFDQQLLSPIDQSQKAVYVMTGKEIEPSGIASLYQRDSNSNEYYDLCGRRIDKPIRGIFISNGKKVVISSY